jgi:RND family efflux transporter MFP subunit
VVEEAKASPRSIEQIQAEQGKPVQVSSVSREDIAQTQTFYGTAIPYAEANVQGKYGGKLILLQGREGDRVEAGEVIVKLDDSDSRLQLQQAIAAKNSALQSVNQAESNFETAQTDLKRYQQLLTNGFVSKQNVDAMQNQALVAQANLQSAREQVKNAEAQIKLLENTLKDMKIKAPIGGIIDEKHFNLNEISGAEAVIYHIVDIDRVYIEVEVPESHISAIREEMSVDVTFDSLKGQEFSGTVERIIPTGNRQNRNFIVKVLIENPNHLIKPSMFARVNVCLEEIPNALVLDKKALLKEGDSYYVFKVNENQVEKVAVTVKHRAGQHVAVLSEKLAEQDRVVVEGVRMLQTDDRVNVL